MRIARTVAALAAATALAGCATTSHTAQTTTAAAPPSFATTAPEDTHTAAMARQQIEELQPSWLPYVSDVTYRDGRLTVALQVDRNTDGALADKVAKAVATNMSLGNPELQRTVGGVDVTDGAGSFITQAPVSTRVG